MERNVRDQAKEGTFRMRGIRDNDNYHTCF